MITFRVVRSFPLDTVKTHIQSHTRVAAASSQDQPRFASVVAELWKKRGIRAFYSGLTPSITRAFIVSSSRFSAFELTLHWLAKLQT